MEIIKSFLEFSVFIFIFLIIAFSFIVIVLVPKANKFTLFTFGKVLFGHFEKSSEFSDKIGELQRKLDLETISDMFFGEYIAQLSGIISFEKDDKDLFLFSQKRVLISLILDYFLKFVLINEKQKKRGAVFEVFKNGRIEALLFWF